MRLSVTHVPTSKKAARCVKSKKKIMAELPDDKEIRGAAKRVLARFF